MEDINKPKNTEKPKETTPKAKDPKPMSVKDINGAIETKKKEWSGKYPEDSFSVDSFLKANPTYQEGHKKASESQKAHDDFISQMKASTPEEFESKVGGLIQNDPNNVYLMGLRDEYAKTHKANANALKDYEATLEKAYGDEKAEYQKSIEDLKSKLPHEKQKKMTFREWGASRAKDAIAKTKPEELKKLFDGVAHDWTAYDPWLGTPELHKKYGLPENTTPEDFGAFMQTYTNGIGNRMYPSGKYSDSSDGSIPYSPTQYWLYDDDFEDEDSAWMRGVQKGARKKYIEEKANSLSSRQHNSVSKGLAEARSWVQWGLANGFITKDKNGKYAVSDGAKNLQNKKTLHTIINAIDDVKAYERAMSKIRGREVDLEKATTKIGNIVSGDLGKMEDAVTDAAKKIASEKKKAEAEIKAKYIENGWSEDKYKAELDAALKNIDDTLGSEYDSASRRFGISKDWKEGKLGSILDKVDQGISKDDKALEIAGKIRKFYKDRSDSYLSQFSPAKQKALLNAALNGGRFSGDEDVSTSPGILNGLSDSDIKSLLDFEINEQKKDDMTDEEYDAHSKNHDELVEKYGEKLGPMIDAIATTLGRNAYLANMVGNDDSSALSILANLYGVNPSDIHESEFVDEDKISMIAQAIINDDKDAIKEIKKDESLKEPFRIVKRALRKKGAKYAADNNFQTDILKKMAGEHFANGKQGLFENNEILSTPEFKRFMNDVKLSDKSKTFYNDGLAEEALGQSEDFTNYVLAKDNVLKGIESEYDEAGKEAANRLFTELTKSKSRRQNDIINAPRIQRELNKIPYGFPVIPDPDKEGFDATNEESFFEEGPKGKYKTLSNNAISDVLNMIRGAFSREASNKGKSMNRIDRSGLEQLAETLLPEDLDRLEKMAPEYKGDINKFRDFVVNHFLLGKGVRERLSKNRTALKGEEGRNLWKLMKLYQPAIEGKGLSDMFEYTKEDFRKQGVPYDDYTELQDLLRNYVGWTDQLEDHYNGMNDHRFLQDEEGTLYPLDSERFSESSHFVPAKGNEEKTFRKKYDFGENTRYGKDNRGNFTENPSGNYIKNESGGYTEAPFTYVEATDGTPGEFALSNTTYQKNPTGGFVKKDGKYVPVQEIEDQSKGRYDVSPADINSIFNNIMNGSGLTNDPHGYNNSRAFELLISRYMEEHPESGLFTKENDKGELEAKTKGDEFSDIEKEELVKYAAEQAHTASEGRTRERGKYALPISDDQLKSLGKLPEKKRKMFSALRSLHEDPDSYNSFVYRNNVNDAIDAMISALRMSAFKGKGKPIVSDNKFEYDDYHEMPNYLSVRTPAGYSEFMDEGKIAKMIIDRLIEQSNDNIQGIKNGGEEVSDSYHNGNIKSNFPIIRSLIDYVPEGERKGYLDKATEIQNEIMDDRPELYKNDEFDPTDYSTYSPTKIPFDENSAAKSHFNVRQTLKNIDGRNGWTNKPKEEENPSTTPKREPKPVYVDVPEYDPLNKEWDGDELKQHNKNAELQHEITMRHKDDVGWLKEALERRKRMKPNIRDNFVKFIPNDDTAPGASKYKRIDLLEEYLERLALEDYK